MNAYNVEIIKPGTQGPPGPAGPGSEILSQLQALVAQAETARDVALATGGGWWTADVDAASFRGDSAGTASASGLYVFTRFFISTNLPLTNLTCRVKTQTTGGANGIASASIASPPALWTPNTPANWTSSPAYGTTSMDMTLTATTFPVTQLQVNWTGISASDFPTQFIFGSTQTPNRTVTLTCSLSSVAAPYLTWTKVTATTA